MDRMLSEDPDGLFISEMIAPDEVLLTLATNSRRVACESLLAPAVLAWASYKIYREKSPDDTVEGVIAMIWERMNDEIEKDELDAKEDKKLKAA